MTTGLVLFNKTINEAALPFLFLGPKMVAVQNYHGNPAPPGKPVLTFQTGDVIELLRGDPDSQWWEVSGAAHWEMSRDTSVVAAGSSQECSDLFLTALGALAAGV